MRGLFVTFEGIDKSGKTTQVRLLTDALTRSGCAVVSTTQPGGSSLGAEIWRLIRDPRHFGRMAPLTELMLFAADRAQNVREVILPALDAGKVVVCDRYTDSTVAYQGYGRGLNLDTISALNDAATEGLVPDLTIFIDIPVEEARRRGMGESIPLSDRLSSLDRMEMEQISFFERVREGYLCIAASDRKRIVALNGCDTTERISENVRAVVEAALKRK